MSVWQWLKAIYSLDTLDTRFTATARAPGQSTQEEKQSSKHGPGEPRAVSGRPSKWNTLEYYFHYFIFITIIPLMFYSPYTASKSSHPEYHKFAPLLSDGWVPGRKVDNSDLQYASFRGNVPFLAIAMALHPLLRLLYDRLFTVGLDGSKGSGKDFQAVRAKTRVAYDLIFAVLFMIVLHGVSAPKILLILYVNFTVATRLPTSAVPLATWAFNMTILFANELCHGYPYSWLAEYVPFGTAPNGAKLYVDVGQRLDSYGGLVSQWQVLFKITILRLISFNLDYYWSIKNGGTQAIEKKQLDPSLLSERERVSTPASPEAYKFRNYLAYVLYSPLYLAGPIITFNDYTTQLRHRPASIQPGRTALYGFRFLLTLLTMELILHFIYAVAISKSDPDWSQYSPFQISMLGFFNLHIIWLKLLLPWRFFRLWALIDGIDPPENMVRCMSNNYSALAFWRGWHRSYNKWVVRYLFIPLGGSGRHTSFLRGLGNTLVVFTFVALWHDINRRLLWWSWLVVLFLMPELICSTVLFPARNYRDKPETYRVLSGIGAVANVLMMMAANLVGFALGVDGLQSMIKGLVSGWEGFAFFGAACTVLFVGVMVMFEIREDERRRGIDLKC